MDNSFEGDVNLYLKKVLSFPEIGLHYDSTYHRIFWLKIHSSQITFTCSESIIETLEIGMKNVQSSQ